MVSVVNMNNGEERHSSNTPLSTKAHSLFYTTPDLYITVIRNPESEPTTVTLSLNIPESADFVIKTFGASVIPLAVVCLLLAFIVQIYVECDLTEALIKFVILHITALVAMGMYFTTTTAHSRPNSLLVRLPPGTYIDRNAIPGSSRVVCGRPLFGSDSGTAIAALLPPFRHPKQPEFYNQTDLWITDSDDQ